MKSREKTTNQSKMFKIRTELSKLWLIVFLFGFNTKYCYSGSVSSLFHDFDSLERMKFNIFTKSYDNLSKYANSTNDWQCLEELNDVRKALTNSELWATKIVDAWGKWPSGILDGNLYEFGSFPECFHIDRNGELYQTKYCLGQIQLDMKGMRKYREYFPQPENSTAITFGICVPAHCSMEFLQNQFTNQIDNNELPIKLLENSCQIEENSWEFTTLDWFAAVIFILILILILMSTAYDVHCSLYTREKFQAFLPFSLYSNGKKLFSYEISKSADKIRCLDGVRVITTLWILFGHVYLILARLPIQNENYFATFQTELFGLIPETIALGPDTFFIISGLLVTINTLKILHKTNGKINVPIMYLRRYWRLTPVLGITILWIVSLWKFFGSGPLWPTVVNSHKVSCDENWWLTLLYIQNYVHADRICKGVSWYLAADMQLFLISPLIIYLIYRFNKKTIYALQILAIACIGMVIDAYVTYDYTGELDKLPYVYYPTHLRYLPWLFGVTTGYIFHEARNKNVHIPKAINISAWTVSLGVMLACILARYPFTQPDRKGLSLWYAVYETMSRTGWSISLCYIIFACYHNFGGPINSFLGHPLWQPLSRMSYSLYLLQYSVIFVTTGTFKQSFYFTESTLIFTFIVNCVVLIFVSIITTLAIEMPAFEIEKLIFQSKRSHNDKK